MEQKLADLFKKMAEKLENELATARTKRKKNALIRRNLTDMKRALA